MTQVSDLENDDVPPPISPPSLPLLVTMTAVSGGSQSDMYCQLYSRVFPTSSLIQVSS